MANTAGNLDNRVNRKQMTGKDLAKGIVCLVIALVMGVVDRIPLIPDEEITLTVTGWLIMAGFSVVSYIWRAAASVLLCVAAAIILRFIISRIKTNKPRTETVLILLFNTIGYVFVIVGFILILVSFNVDIVGVGATIGILTIVLGFGAQELIADVFAGMCLLFENQFNVNDIIVVDDFRGEVESIGFRTTTVRDVGDNIKIFNNSDLRNIINCSRQSSLAVCDVGVGYDSDLEAVENAVNSAILKLRSDNLGLFKKIEYWGIESLSDYAIILRVVGETSENKIYDARRLINKALLVEFKANNIVIPTVDVQDHNGD